MRRLPRRLPLEQVRASQQGSRFRRTRLRPRLDTQKIPFTERRRFPHSFQRFSHQTIEARPLPPQRLCRLGKYRLPGRHPRIANRCRRRRSPDRRTCPLGDCRNKATGLNMGASSPSFGSGQKYSWPTKSGSGAPPSVDLTALFFNLTVAWDKLARCAVGSFDGGSGWI